MNKTRILCTFGITVIILVSKTMGSEFESQRVCQNPAEGIHTRSPKLFADRELMYSYHHTQSWSCSTEEPSPSRGVAQLDSAFGLGPKGRKFESSHPDHRRVGSNPTNDYKER